jgi:integration host factor subunit alpha
MTLTKAGIVQAVVQKTDLGKAQSIQLVDTLFEIIRQTLESGEDVLISGFGKWSVKEKQERQGRNPQTGEPLTLAPRKVVRFKCPSVLRDKLNRRR